MSEKIIKCQNCGSEVICGCYPRLKFKPTYVYSRGVTICNCCAEKGICKSCGREFTKEDYRNLPAHLQQ